MIDIHSHIISGVDDGARDNQVSLTLLRMAAAAGTTDIIATPHVVESANRLKWKLIKEETAKLNEMAADDGLSIRIHAGAELEMNWDMLSILEGGKEDYCLAGSRYILVELPANSIPRYADEFLYEIQLRELVPILAHPERNPLLMKQPHVLHQWVKNGALVQCNAGSFFGKFGRHIKVNAEFLLQHKLVHFLGSDAHNIEHRHTDNREALAEIAQKVQPEQFDAIVKGNPQTILDNRFMSVTVGKMFTGKKKEGRSVFSKLWRAIQA